MTVELRLVCGHVEKYDRVPRRDKRGWFADRACPEKCRRGKQRVVELHSREEKK